MGAIVKLSRPTRLFLTITTALPALDVAMAQEQGTALAPIVVQTQPNEDNGGTSNTINQRTARTATKSSTPVVETPQAIATITRKQIDEQNPQTVGEALRYTAGVLSDRDSNTRYDSVFIRGFGAFGTATNYVSFLDGLKLPRGQAFANTSIDPFFLDHVDVLKGPSALLYGQVSPGGLVNQVSRVPSSTAANEARIEAGTDGRVQGGLYSSGPITSDGTVQYGVSIVGRSAGTRYDDVDERRIGIAPTVRWQPDADTTLTVSGYYQRDPEGGYFNSIYPTFLAPAAYSRYLTRDFNIGDPSFDSFERNQYGVGYQFEHSFNDAVTVRSNFRYSGVDIDFQSLQMAGAPSAAGIIPRYAIHSIEDVSGIAFDNQAEFKAETGALDHTFLVGVDLQRSSSSWQYLMASATSIDVANPAYNQPVGAFAPMIDSDQDVRQTGVYLQDQIEWDRLRAVVGVRRDWLNQDSGTSEQSINATSYRAGLLYLFDNGIAPYASYATSFEPVIGVDAGGNPFDPTKANQYEIGIKYQPTGLDALFTVSAFDIRQENVLTPGPVAGFNVQQGEVRSRGIELEARGSVTTNLELIAALTFLDTEFSKSTTASLIGNSPQAVPHYYGSLWANYTIDSGALEGLSLGGGVRFVGSSYADDANTVKADGYTLVDAALRYDFGAKSPEFKGLEATLNVNNVFDKDYYSSCTYSIYCQYGNGRSVLAGLRYKW
jgi:iron complex outermembrane recepter protein